MQGDTKTRKDWVAHKAVELGCICRPVKGGTRMSPFGQWTVRLRLCKCTQQQLAAGSWTKQRRAAQSCDVLCFVQKAEKSIPPALRDAEVRRLSWPSSFRLPLQPISSLHHGFV